MHTVALPLLQGTGTLPTWCQPTTYCGPPIATGHRYPPNVMPANHILWPSHCYKAPVPSKRDASQPHTVALPLLQGTGTLPTWCQPTTYCGPPIATGHRYPPNVMPANHILWPSHCYRAPVPSQRDASQPHTVALSLLRGTGTLPTWCQPTTYCGPPIATGHRYPPNVMPANHILWPSHCYWAPVPSQRDASQPHTVALALLQGTGILPTWCQPTTYCGPLIATGHRYPPNVMPANHILWPSHCYGAPVPSQRDASQPHTVALPLLLGTGTLSTWCQPTTYCDPPIATGHRYPPNVMPANHILWPSHCYRAPVPSQHDASQPHTVALPLLQGTGTLPTWCQPTTYCDPPIATGPQYPPNVMPANHIL